MLDGMAAQEKNMEKSTFEQELERKGNITYTCRGISMLPLLRQKRDLFTITKKQGDAGSMMWHFTSAQMGLMYCTASSRCCRMDMYFWETIV